MKKFIVDRFEENYAVCETEDKKMVNIHRSELPENAKEGDVLILLQDNKYFIDSESTRQRRERIKKKMNSLWE